jgi:signal transduction histidine kinase
MLLQKNSLRRLQSSTRTELARDLHDSLAQDLVAIGFQLDLLINALPTHFRADAREIRLAVTDATNSVRRELFALRDLESDYQADLASHASPLHLQVNGDVNQLSAIEKRILSEIVKNASDHSKGHNVIVDLSEHRISVQDDGQGMYGVSELVDEVGGEIAITSNRTGTKVEITLP